MFDHTRSMKRVFVCDEAVRQLSACGRLLKNDTNKIESNLLEEIEEEHHILQWLAMQAIVNFDIFLTKICYNYN